MKKAIFYFIKRLLKGLVILFTRLVFRLEVRGLDNIPKEVGAMIISNHVSFLDNLVLVAAIPRDVGFVMAAQVYRNPLLNWLLKRLPMVPIESGKDRSYLDQFNQDCQSKINAGNLVCIYAEGQISRNGHLLGFKKGLEFIGNGLKKECKIIPVHIDGLLGTPLSYDNIKKKNYSFSFKNLFKRVLVTIGAPVENTTSAFEVRQAVKELEVHNFSERIANTFNLINSVNSLKKGWNEELVLDNLSAEKLWELSQSYALKLQPILETFNLVGVQLSDLKENTITNLALAALGKTAINFSKERLTMVELNNAGVELLICDEDSGFRSLKFEFPVSYANVLSTKVEIFKQLEVAKFKTSQGYFSMTHENLLAYFSALKQLFALGKDSKIYCQYSSDSAIGYFVNIWLPLLVNAQILNESNKEKSNVLIGDVKFINGFETEFGTKNMRTIVLLDGSQKDLISEVNIEAVYQGLRSDSSCPVLTLNSPDFEGSSLGGKTIKQEGRNIETVGRPLPGVNIKVVNELGESLGVNEFGKVMAKGVLFGEQGWIFTGVRGKVNEGGFLMI